MGVRCCGSERNSAYCPSCGTKLGERSPLVELLVHVRQQVKTCETKALQAERRARFWQDGGWTTQSEDRQLKEARRKLALWRKWESALSDTIDGNHARVMSDWLKENGFDDAGEALLRTFGA